MYILYILEMSGNAMESKGLFPNTYNSVMFSHTALRNVGLYTSIAFAALAAAARLNNKNQSTLAIFILIGALVFLVISYMINNMLYTTMGKEVQRMKGDIPESIKTTQKISYVLFPVHYVLILIVFIGLFRSVRASM